MDPNGGGDRLLTVREVAERLAASTPIVYSLCERGEIRHVRVSNAIRVLPRDLDAFIAGGLGSRGLPVAGAGPGASGCACTA